MFEIIVNVMEKKLPQKIICFSPIVPSAGPGNVTANATSSTTIVVRWKEVPKLHQNGIIEGYKIVYVGK